MGFTLIYTDDFFRRQIPKGTDVVVIFKSPQSEKPRMMYDLAKLSKKIKLIGYYSDIHSGLVRYKDGRLRRKDLARQKEYFRCMNRLLKRCDKILCSYDFAFRKQWPQYIDKYEFFPGFAFHVEE